MIDSPLFYFLNPTLNECITRHIDALDLPPVPHLLSMPILNNDKTPFKQIVIQHS